MQIYRKPSALAKGSSLEAPRGKHSEKPLETQDRIVQLFGDLPRVELFATQNSKEDWTRLGYDIDGRDLRKTIPELARR